MPPIDRTRDREIVRLALPALGALAAEPTYLLVDTAVIGHLGTSQLAALGLAATFIAGLFWIFKFVADATTTQVANVHGAGRPELVAGVVTQAVWLALAIGAMLMFVGFTFAPQFVELLQARGKVAEHAAVYIRISALGAPFVMLALAGQGWARGVQRMDIPLKILVVSNLLNVVLEVLFVYGFEWGIAGSAWGTVIAQGVAAACFLWVIRKPLAERVGIVWEQLRPLLSFGGDLFVRSGLMLLCFNGVNAMLARQGATPLAANQVLFQLMVFLALSMDSIAIAGQSLIGGELGAAARRSARAYARRITVLSFYAGVVLAALLVLGHDQLPRAFTSDPEVLHEIARVWWLFVIYNLLSSLIYAWDGVLLGGGDSRAMMIVAAVGAALCIPAALWLIDDPTDAIIGAWVAFSLLNLARLFGNGLRVRSGRWAR